MRTMKYTFWQDGEFFLGYLNEYPEYQTQAYSKDELVENLKDLLSVLCLFVANPIYNSCFILGFPH